MSKLLLTRPTKKEKKEENKNPSALTRRLQSACQAVRLRCNDTPYRSRPEQTKQHRTAASESLQLAEQKQSKQTGRRRHVTENRCVWTAHLDKVIASHWRRQTNEWKAQTQLDNGPLSLLGNSARPLDWQRGHNVTTASGTQHGPVYTADRNPLENICYFKSSTCFGDFSQGFWNKLFICNETEKLKNENVAVWPHSDNPNDSDR